MKIKPLKDADFSKVEIHLPFGLIRATPHCINHGAMNKMTSDGAWRCISTVGVRKMVNGNSVSYKEIDNECNAGCQEDTQ